MSTNILTFVLNGEPRTVANPSPHTTVLEYLRETEGLTGTKSSCTQGGCGACVAMLSFTPPGSTATTHASFNTCLKPLVALAGCSVTTVEGIGSTRAGLNPIQAAVADGNGSQCGFCTPGMVMAAYSLCAELGSNPTMAQLEAKLDGNICRCTGYRAIASALHTVASDGPAAADPPSTLLAPLPDLAAVAAPAAFSDPVSGVQWIMPTDLAGVAAAVAEHGAAARFVGGNTSVGVYPSADADAGIATYVYLRAVPELAVVETTDAGVSVGGGRTIADLIAALDAAAPSSPNTFPAAIDHLSNIASSHIRSAGGWAGNLAMARDHGFASDLATVLAGLGATVTVRDLAAGTDATVSVLAFVAGDAAPSSLATSLFVPFGAPNEYFRSYRTAIRPVNAHALINAAFRVTVVDDMVSAASVVFGAVAPTPLAALGTAGALIGSSLDDAALAAALAAVDADLASVLHAEPQYITPRQPEGKVAYRAGVARSFVYKCVADLRAAATSHPVPAPIAASVALAPPHRARPPVSGKQVHPTGDDSLYGARPKASSRKQASGEAIYTADIPDARSTLHAAFALSTAAGVTLASVDVDAVMGLPGVVDVLVAADIPGSNDIGAMFPGEQEVLVSEKVPYVGAPIALVVAKTAAAATAAAAALPITYGPAYEDVIVDVRAAAAAGRILEGSTVEEAVGDVDAALASAAHTLEGRLSVGSQDHFYMEKQVAYAVIDEGGRVVLHSANQAPTLTRLKVATAVGMAPADLEVRVRRCGGAFGGKATHQLGVAAACTVAARKLGVSVRAALPIGTNMAAYGGRSAYEVDYKIGYDDDGHVVALSLHSLGDSGFAHDLIGFCLNEYNESLDTVYHIPNAKYVAQAVRTNTPATTAVRGPGHPQASFVIESIFDLVAAHTGLSAEAVREANFYSPRTAVAMNGEHMRGMNMAALYARAKADFDYDATMAAVADFNAAHKWVKRGVSVQCSRYAIAQVASSGAAVFVNVATHGVVNVHHGGVEIGQGIDVKIAAVVAHTFGIPVDAVRIADTSTDVVPNTKFTGASVTSEVNAEAARRAAVDILARIAHVKDEMWRNAADGAEPAFFAVAAAAEARGIQLMAAANFVCLGRESTPYNPRPWQVVGSQYSAFSAAASLVELDILTGELAILRTDIVYDTAQSLNETVDVGQIEGAYIMGVGAMLSEEMLISPDGAPASTDTWEYKPPVLATTPHEFNVALEHTPFPYNNALATKAVGEPPISLAMTVVSAARAALAASIKERRPGATGADAVLQCPMTVDRMWSAADVTPADLVIE